MAKKKRVMPMVMIVLALLTLGRFSQGVRAVNILGLFASGALAGASFAMLVGPRR
jgi:hypothetical protein